MLPRVTLHNAVSLDGRLLEWGMVDMGLYYGLAGAFSEQATLAGTETLLTGAAHEGVVADGDDTPRSDSVSGDSRPLLVVPDSQGRVRIWRWMLAQPYWRAGIALCSSSTPREHVAYLERSGVARIVAGADRVDLKAALAEVRRWYGIERIRADSGGTLNGVLLRLGLVDEISLLVAPVLMGDDASRSFAHAPAFAAAGGYANLKLTHMERLAGDHLWLRYEVVRGS